MRPGWRCCVLFAGFIHCLHGVRPEDQHCYLVVKHHNDLETPSWMLSDGTLRLLALTLLAYVPDGDGICLLEVPENGLHSGAVEAVFKAFSAVAQHEDRARAQILTTTHSPRCSRPG